MPSASHVGNPTLDALTHACQQICQTGPENNSPCMAWNLLHDHRLRPDWLTSWCHRYGVSANPSSLVNALKSYENRLRDQTVDAFADLASLGGLAVNPHDPSAPQPGDELVHVLDLWSRDSQAAWVHGRDQQIGDLAGHNDLDLSSRLLPASIAAKLTSPDVAEQVEILGSFFEAWKSRVDLWRGGAHPPIRSTFSPTWCTLWKPWHACMEDNAHAWASSVGLSKKFPAWFVVLRYPVSSVPRLWMPTQLEAGNFGRHFPSPPPCTIPAGGRVVEGRNSVACAGTSLTEYLHVPIAFSEYHWLWSGYPARSTAPLGLDATLPNDRLNHFQRLQTEFGSAPVQSWMPRPNPN